MIWIRRPDSDPPLTPEDSEPPRVVLRAEPLAIYVRELKDILTKGLKPQLRLLHILRLFRI